MIDSASSLVKSKGEISFGESYALKLSLIDINITSISINKQLTETFLLQCKPYLTEAG